MRRLWADTYVAQQRRLFVTVWVTHVNAQLQRLNELSAPQKHLLRDIPQVGPLRTAAVFAAEWMQTPERLARHTDPEDDSNANRAAVRTALVLATGAVSGLHPQMNAEWGRLIDGLNPEVAAHLRTAPLARWEEVRHLALRLGLDDDPRSWDDFLDTASTNSLNVEQPRYTELARSPTRKRTARTTPQWIPASSVNWFGPRARMASRPTQEKRHAVVDAFFFDGYYKLPTGQHESPVRLLATFPESELVDPPDPGQDGVEYERACWIQDIAWHQAFADLLAGYSESTLAADVLDQRRHVVVGLQSPAASSAVPAAPAALTVLADRLDGSLMSAHAVSAACRAAIDRLRRVSPATRASTVALAVLAWFADGCPDPVRDQVTSSVTGLSPLDRHVMLTLCHDALGPSEAGSFE